MSDVHAAAAAPAEPGFILGRCAQAQFGCARILACHQIICSPDNMII